MCSNDPAAGLAARLGSAIDELAAAASAADAGCITGGTDQLADRDVAVRLAAAWALIAAADPELAERTARYSP